MLSNVLTIRTIKSTPEEFSFYGVNLTFLLIIIVLSILCLNIIIIGISVTSYRSVFKRTIFLKNFCPKRMKKRREPLYIASPVLIPLTSTSSELGSCEGAEPLVRDTEETFV